MSAHKTAYYMDGQLKVEYCKLCGYEGVNLICDCPGKFENKELTLKNRLSYKSIIETALENGSNGVKR